MAITQRKPEEKYHNPHPAKCSGLIALKSPLSEGAIEIRTGWFKTPPKLEFKIGQEVIFSTGPLPEGMEEKEEEPQRLMLVQKSINFPQVDEEGDFAILVGRLGGLTGDKEVAFLHGKDQSPNWLWQH